MKCFICGGSAYRTVGKNDVQHKQVHTTVSNHYCKCLNCKSEFVTPDQSTLNKNIMLEFKKWVDTTISTHPIR